MKNIRNIWDDELDGFSCEHRYYNSCGCRGCGLPEIQKKYEFYECKNFDGCPLSWREKASEICDFFDWGATELCDYGKNKGKKCCEKNCPKLGKRKPK